MKTKKVLNFLYLIIVIQLIRIALKNIAFLFIKPSLLSNLIINLVITIFITLIIVCYIRLKHDQNNIQKKQKQIYFSFAIFVFIFNFISLVIFKNFNTINYLTLLLNILVIPLFEELLFRGYIWEELKKDIHNDYLVLVIVAIFSGIWQLGYIDGIIINNIFLKIPFDVNDYIWQMIAGIGLGVLTGLSKIKFKNYYVSALVHAFAKTIAR